MPVDVRSLIYVPITQGYFSVPDYTSEKHSTLRRWIHNGILQVRLKEWVTVEAQFQ